MTMLFGLFAFLSCLALVTSNPIKLSKRWPGCQADVDSPLLLGGHLSLSDPPPFAAFDLKGGSLGNTNNEAAFWNNGQLYFGPTAGPATFELCNASYLAYTDTAGTHYTDFAFCPTSTNQLAIFLTPPAGETCTWGPLPLTLGTAWSSVWWGTAATVPYPLVVSEVQPVANHHYQAKYQRVRRADSGPVAVPRAMASLRPHRLMATTMFKNKRRYLPEWIEFHRLVGVNKFVLYDHESTDNPLVVLQPYIDAGIVDYVPWPPLTLNDVHPVSPRMATEDVVDQTDFLQRSLHACWHQEWITHRQVACQFAASVDFLRRAAGQADWVGFWDTDEFVYPTSEVSNPNLVDLFENHFPGADNIVLSGSTFGTNGHLTLTEPHLLVTENYLRRRALNDDGPSPFAAGAAEFKKRSSVGGELAQLLTMPETFARKAFVRPDLAIYSHVHDWVQLPSASQPWARVDVWLDDNRLKMNHYGFLSREEANRKAVDNGNPMAAYDEEQDAFFSKEIDLTIQWLVDALRSRMRVAVGHA